MKNMSVYTKRGDRGITDMARTKNVSKSDDRIQLVGAIDDVATCSAKVIAYGIHINFRLCELEVAEEDAIEVVVVVLACVGENHIEVLAALVDDCGKADNLRTCTDDDAKLQFAILLPLYIGIICFHFLIYLRGQNRYLGDWG